MELKIKSVRGRAIPLRGDDIDTDRIIPARYLKEITFENMGKYAFYDQRFDAKGNRKKHPFNDENTLGLPYSLSEGILDAALQGSMHPNH